MQTTQLIETTLEFLNQFEIIVNCKDNLQLSFDGYNTTEIRLHHLQRLCLELNARFTQENRERVFASCLNETVFLKGIDVSSTGIGVLMTFENIDPWLQLTFKVELLNADINFLHRTFADRKPFFYVLEELLENEFCINEITIDNIRDNAKYNRLANKS